MTKEQLFAKWTINPDLKSDLEAVIATEIAKVQEAKLKHADQVTDQEPDQVAKPAKPFDRERFERMFCAVVASNRSDNEFIDTENILAELDAYYASKEKGGNNE